MQTFGENGSRKKIHEKNIGFNCFLDDERNKIICLAYFFFIRIMWK